VSGLIITGLLNTIMSHSFSNQASPTFKSYQRSSMPKTTDVCLGGYGWKVMCFAEGLDRSILNKIYNCLTTYLTWHSKMLMIRLDFSLYDSPSHNQDISKSLQHIAKIQKKRYGCIVGYGWVREQNSTDDKCHYHCFILLDGHKVQNSKTTFDLVLQIKNIVIDINPHVPEHCYYMIRRNELDSFQAALYRLSYLAKNASKQHQPMSAKWFSFSRIKARPINKLTGSGTAT
jgi:hypothetical protein